MGTPKVMRSDIHQQVLKSFIHITSSPEYSTSNGLAPKTIQAVKCLLEKAKDDSEDSYLVMLEGKNTSVDNYHSPTGLAVGRKLRSVLLVNSDSLKIKANDDDNKYKERRRNKANIVIKTQRK